MGQFVEFSANILLDNQCTIIQSFGRMEGQGVNDEGVDVANSLGCYCWSRLVVRVFDRRKSRIHDVVHSDVLAGVDLDSGTIRNCTKNPLKIE